MDNILGLIVSFGFIIYFIVKIYLAIKIFNNQDIKVKATVLDSNKLKYEDDETHIIRVSYWFENKRHETKIKYFSFKMLKTEDEIKIRIDPKNPEKACYYGKNDYHFYFTLFLYCSIVAILIFYCIAYLNSILSSR